MSLEVIPALGSGAMGWDVKNYLLQHELISKSLSYIVSRVDARTYIPQLQHAVDKVRHGCSASARKDLATVGIK